MPASQQVSPLNATVAPVRSLQKTPIESSHPMALIRRLDFGSPIISAIISEYDLQTNLTTLKQYPARGTARSQTYGRRPNERQTPRAYLNARSQTHERQLPRREPTWALRPRQGRREKQTPNEDLRLYITHTRYAPLVPSYRRTFLFCVFSILRSLSIFFNSFHVSCVYCELFAKNSRLCSRVCSQLAHDFLSTLNFPSTFS
jgi:hypothetical protein